MDLVPAERNDAERYLREVEGISISPDELVVGVAPRRWFHIRNNFLPHKWRVTAGLRAPGEERFERFKTNLAAALNRAVEGRRVRFLMFPFYSAPWEGDDRESVDLARRLRAPCHVLRLDCAPSLIKAMTGLCHMFVAVRLHAGILALGMGVPTVAIAYTAKAPELFRSIAEEDRLADIAEAADDGGAERLEKLFRDTLDNRERSPAN